jgi:hypothetical protein
MSNIVEFRGQPKPRKQAQIIDDEEDEYVYERRQAPFREGALHTLSYRSYDLIVRSDEAELVRDVSFDLDKAQRKLKSIQRQLQRDREHAIAREQLLTVAATKLSAAIVTALLATKGKDQTPPSIA